MRRLAIGVLAAGGLAAGLAGCGGPGVDQLAAGRTAAVAEVRTGDLVVLQGGEVVRLAGVEAPKGAEPFAAEARQALSGLVLGRKVQLMYGGARQDAYGRTLAHLKLAKGGWVERALLKAGAVRVHTYADNRALARVMLDDEARARIAGRGLWALPAYRVRLPDEAAARPFGFQLVEGRVSAAADGAGGIRIDLERRIEADIPAGAEGAFASAGLDLAGLPGKLVRVRGLVRRGGREGVMRLDHPEQIEVLRER